MRKDEIKTIFDNADIFDQTGAAVSERESLGWFHEDMESLYPDTVEILGYNMCPVAILRECDPVAYREEYLQWIDTKIRDYEFFDNFAEAKTYALEHGYADEGEFQ